MLINPLILSLALLPSQGHQPHDVARDSLHVGVGIGVGGHGRDHVNVGFDFGDHYAHRHYSNYGYRPYYAPSVVYVEPAPVYVQPQPVYVPAPQPQTVIVDRPVEKTVYVDRPVEKTVTVDRIVEKPVEKIVTVDRVIERTVFMDGKKTTILEKVDGKVKSITHAPSEAKKLDDNAEMAVLCNIRDEINRRLPLEVANVAVNGATRNVEVVFRATKFAPYDRVTRRYVVNANTLSAVGSDLTIHFNADQEGIADLGSDFQDLLYKMASECQATGGDWYLDNKFAAEPKIENGKPLKAIIENMDAQEKK